jgi:uncharacterized membrane protein
MELWFIYAIASAVFGGAYAFIQKIAAERGYSSALVNMWSTVVSSLCALILALVFFDLNGTWKIGVLLGIASGITLMIGTIFRMDALKHIDTSIFFPLYKTFGPILAVLAGLMLFAENFSTAEWIGIAFGITVPLLLLHRGEQERQKNLSYGLLLMFASVLFASLAIVVSKYGAGVFNSIFVFIAVSHTFGALSAWLIYTWQKRSATRNGREFLHRHGDTRMLVLAVASGVTQFLGFWMIMLSFYAAGPLGIVYTINSFYILIPIVLSVWWYKEHFNLRKGLAVALSIIALAFLG